MGMLSQSRVQGIHSRRFCRCLSVLELLYGEPDLDIGGKMVVEAVHHPHAGQGHVRVGPQGNLQFQNAHYSPLNCKGIQSFCAVCLHVHMSATFNSTPPKLWPGKCTLLAHMLHAAKGCSCCECPLGDYMSHAAAACNNVSTVCCM